LGCHTKRVRQKGLTMPRPPQDLLDEYMKATPEKQQKVFGMLPPDLQQDFRSALNEGQRWSARLGLQDRGEEPASVGGVASTMSKNVVDFLEGLTGKAAQGVFKGGDIIRRGLGMERVIDRPEVQQAMTVPQTVAGKAGSLAGTLGELYATGLAGKGIGAGLEAMAPASAAITASTPYWSRVAKAIPQAIGQGVAVGGLGAVEGDSAQSGIAPGLAAAGLTALGGPWLQILNRAYGGASKAFDALKAPGGVGDTPIFYGTKPLNDLLTEGADLLVRSGKGHPAETMESAYNALVDNLTNPNRPTNIRELRGIAETLSDIRGSLPNRETQVYSDQLRQAVNDLIGKHLSPETSEEFGQALKDYAMRSQVGRVVKKAEPLINKLGLAGLGYKILSK
jgi:hypothetical protein